MEDLTCTIRVQTTLEDVPFSTCPGWRNIRKGGIDGQAEDDIVTEISELVMDLGPAMQELFESGAIKGLPFGGGGGLENEFEPSGESFGEENSIILLRRGPQQSGSRLSKKLSGVDDQVEGGRRRERDSDTIYRRGNSRAGRH